MPDFSVIRVKADGFETVLPVYKLVRNGRCRFDEFLKDIEADNNLTPELGDLYAILEEVANCTGILPKNKYRRLHLPKNLAFHGYEAKSKHLRLYLFHDKGTGQIIAFGGKKGDQDEDISRFEKTIKEYTESKNQKKQKK